MNTAIGARIRGLRENRGLTQEEVAMQLGFTRQRLARLESGDADISYNVMCRLAEIFCVGITDITDAAKSDSSITMLFRQNEKAPCNPECGELFEILEIIYAHKEIYRKTRGES